MNEARRHAVPDPVPSAATRRRAASSPRRWLLPVVLPVVLLGLSGCGAMNAQNPSGALRPVNAVADADDDRLMLRGADVVAYFTEARHVQGSPQFESVHEGVTFRFASAAISSSGAVQPVCRCSPVPAVSRSRARRTGRALSRS